MAVASLNDVSLCLGTRWVLSHLSLRIEKGSALLITGHNGAGKTSLLRLLATLERPQHGTLELFGQTLGHENLGYVRRRVALMSHAHHFYEALSGKENLALVSRLCGRTKDSLEDSLAQVGLAHAAHQSVSRFSAGMKRRLALARLMLVDAELILLDEPFGQLDDAGSALVDAMLANWRERGKTLVIVSHDPARLYPIIDAELRLVAGSGTYLFRAGTQK